MVSILREGNPRPPVDPFGDGVVEGRLIAHIGDMGDDAATFLFHEAHGLVQIFDGGRFVADIRKHRSADIDGDDVGALGSEPPSMGTPLTAGRARDEHHFALETSLAACHECPRNTVDDPVMIPVACPSFYYPGSTGGRGLPSRRIDTIGFESRPSVGSCPKTPKA